MFATREKAEAWIDANGLNGTLTKYPVDIPIYGFAIQHGWFTPKREYQRSAEFIQQFTSASQAHYHYEDNGLLPQAENAT